MNDRVIGGLLILLSIAAIIFYAYSLIIDPNRKLFDVELHVLTIRGTIMLAALGFFGILAWIGFTLVTTPPPKPIEEIEREIEAELKRMEESK